MRVNRVYMCAKPQKHIAKWLCQFQICWQKNNKIEDWETARWRLEMKDKNQAHRKRYIRAENANGRSEFFCVRILSFARNKSFLSHFVWQNLDFNFRKLDLHKGPKNVISLFFLLLLLGSITPTAKVINTIEKRGRECEIEKKAQKNGWDEVATRRLNIMTS